VFAIVDEMDAARLQNAALLLDAGHICRHEVLHHCCRAHALRRSLQKGRPFCERENEQGLVSDLKGSGRDLQGIRWHLNGISKAVVRT
jgi:hypothetical protein